MPHRYFNFYSRDQNPIHSSASALLKIGAINKETMRSFDDSCLITIPDMNPSQIKKLEKKTM